jgi:hypothetical protein
MTIEGYAALAIDRSLSPSVRVKFERKLTGPWQGAQPADYIDDARNTDAYVHVTEPWWSTHGNDAVIYITSVTDLPDRDAIALLSCALIALIATRAPLRIDLVEHFAERAACWKMGYDYARTYDHDEEETA